MPRHDASAVHVITPTWAELQKLPRNLALVMSELEDDVDMDTVPEETPVVKRKLSRLKKVHAPCLLELRVCSAWTGA